MAMMNRNVMVYIFSKKSMDLKNKAKPARPAKTRITVSMVEIRLVGEGMPNGMPVKAAVREI
jgi:hypothetical protein